MHADEVDVLYLSYNCKYFW